MRNIIEARCPQCHGFIFVEIRIKTMTKKAWYDWEIEFFPVVAAHSCPTDRHKSVEENL